MEEFYISQQGIEIIEGNQSQPIREEGFKLIVLGAEEWDQVPLLGVNSIEEQADWIKRIREKDDEAKVRAKVRDGILVYQPRFERLSKNVHYMRFRDMDKQQNEFPVRLFITTDHFVLLGWNGVDQERLTEWAERGILTNPIELACALGLRVLRHHQQLLDIIEDEMDVLEEEILTATRLWHLKRIIALHRQILKLRRSLNAHQGVFGRMKNLEKPEFGDLQEELIVEMQHVINNAHQTHEMIENLRAAYQSAVDNRANDIMKVLTLVATIILPVTLLTSYFGMNFEFMPFIHLPHGILIFYGISLIIILIVIMYLVKKKWIK